MLLQAKAGEKEMTKLLEPDKYLKYLNKEIVIFTHTNMRLQGQLIDWDNKAITIQKRKDNENGICFKMTTIPIYMIKNIQLSIQNTENGC